MKVGEFELVDPVPEMNNTVAISMLRPWIDVGRVGTLSLRKLEQYLGAKELGRLATPGKFFDFTRYRPRMRIVNGERVFTKPNTIVHHAKDQYSGRDYLFIHIREPHNFGEEYTDSIVELFNYCKVTEYCRIGGMYDSVPHTRPILVTGSMTDAQELDEDHLGASRLLEVLCAVYDFPSDLAEKSRGDQQYKEIEKAIDYGGEVGTLIKQLETYFDRVLTRSDGGEDSDESNPDDPQINLSAGVQDFLNEMGERFEDDRSDPTQRN